MNFKYNFTAFTFDGFQISRGSTVVARRYRARWRERCQINTTMTTVETETFSFSFLCSSVQYNT